MAPRQKTPAEPAANAAVLLQPAHGFDRGVVVRGDVNIIGDLVLSQAARPATERDIAIAGGQVKDLAGLD